MNHPQRSADDRPGEGWSDARFLELARDGGQEEAYRMLIRNMARLRSFLESRFFVDLGGRQGIEEILHEAACKALEHVDSYEPQRGGVLFWVYQIGRNCATDRIRSEEARHEREREVARSERSETDELYRIVREAISKLPDPYRTILFTDLDHGEGCSGELARKFEVQITTIYNLRRQAHILLTSRIR